MPINAHPDYLAAEREFMLAQTIEEKIERLNKMISFAPKHKGAENLRAQLKGRLKKLKEQLIKSKKTARGRGIKDSIKKGDLQVLIIGLTNTGKSSLISFLTNAKPEISAVAFTTKTPAIGIIKYMGGISAQLIEIPAFESEYYNKNLTNSADIILILINDLKEIKKIEDELSKTAAKKIVVFNKVELLNDAEKRKISETLRSKKYDFVLISAKTKEGINELNEKIFKNFNKIKIYTKEPGKTLEERAERPIILNPNSTIKDVAEKILKGFSNKVKEARIWGPSSKFPGQIVGLKHKLKDLDTIEFKTF